MEMRLYNVTKEILKTLVAILVPKGVKYDPH